MMYLLLKELGPKADENIMAFASLVKDVNGDNEINKANAIRVISGFLDVCIPFNPENHLFRTHFAVEVAVADD